MYFNVRLNFKSLILSILFFTSINFISAQTYSLGAAAGYTTYRATTNSNSSTTQTCDCPTGKVIVGIQGGEGGYVDNFKIICATLNANGTLTGAAVVNTQIGNSNLGNAYNESFASTTAMVGATIRTGNELDALTARGNTIANIAASSANSSFTASLSLMGGTGGSSNDDYAPNGNVFVGVRYKNGPYGGGIQFRYAPITVCTPATAPTSVSGTQTICSGQSTTLTVSGGTLGTGGAYQWYAGGCGSGGVLGTNASLTVSPTTTTTYFVRRTANCGSATTCYSVTVTVNAVATAPTSITGNNTICSGSSVTLTANGGTGSVYEWGTGGTVGNNVIGSATGSTYSPSPTSTTTYWVRRKQTSPCSGNTNGVTFTVTVNAPATSPTSISGTSSICAGASVVLTANGGTGSLYQWGTGAVGSNVISGATGVSYTVSPSATTTYWVRRVQQNPCTGNTGGVTFTVTVSSAASSTNITVANGDYIWQGATNADLKATSNWMVFTAPNNYSIATTALSSSTNIFIPKLSTCVNSNFPVIRQPEVTSPNTMVDDIIILPDAVLTFIDEDLYVAGNWLNNGSFDPSNDNVRLNGSGVQTIGGSGLNNFFGLRIYENSPQQDVVLNSDISVSDELRFYDDASMTRNLVLGDFDVTMYSGTNAGDITIRSTAANSNTYTYAFPVSTVGYIKTNGTGKLIRPVTNSNFVFYPIGNSVKNHFAINNTGVADVFALNVLDNVTNNGSGIGATTAAPVVKRTWMVNELVTGGSVVDMRMYWNGASEEINIFDPATQFVAHHTGIDWENLGATSNSLSPLYIQKDDISSFSPFTIGSLGGSPLPVELTSFTAVCDEEKGVNVTWTTASEHNSSHFDVLKSDDGYNWRSIATVSAAGNSMSTINYGMMDAEKANGVAYYKLMQYDIDGASKEYGPISAGCNSLNEMIIKTFPNPSGNEFYVELISPEATSTVITIIDAQGKSVYTRTVETEKGTNLYTFESLNVLPGMYYIQISNDLATPNVVKHSFR